MNDDEYEFKLFPRGEEEYVAYAFLPDSFLFSLPRKVETLTLSSRFLEIYVTRINSVIK